MTLTEFETLIGQGSYVRCQDKKRGDSAIVNIKLARSHIKAGGQIGWWVRSGYIVVDIDEGKKVPEVIMIDSTSKESASIT